MYSNTILFYKVYGRLEAYHINKNLQNKKIYSSYSRTQA